jgi:hypothetical protein
VTGAHVLDVEKDLVTTLLGPHLVTGVARVAEDGANCRLAPHKPMTVRISCTVMPARGCDPLPRQPLCDRETSAPSEVLVEDPLYDWSCIGVRLQNVQPLAIGRLCGVRVRAGTGSR